MARLPLPALARLHDAELLRVSRVRWPRSIAYASHGAQHACYLGYDDTFTTKVLYRMGWKWPITDDAYLDVRGQPSSSARISF
ncbi:MAG: hypothetical protein UHS51_08565 [Atopobiaceae bacterium]|nr:hypothetical protein [Atopobiaceae bacterium]